MNSQIPLNDIRAIAEDYVKKNLPDEHPYFTLVWDQISHPLSALDSDLPLSKSSWLDTFLPKGLGFNKGANLLLYTPAIILVMEAIAIELKAKLTIPTENEVQNALISCATAFGLPKQASNQLGQSLAPKMQQHLSAILSGQPVQAASSQPSAQPFPLEITNHPFVFKRFKSKWWVAFDSDQGWVEHTVGMAVISVLIQHPRKSFSPLALRASAGLNPPIADSKSEQLSAMSDEEMEKEKITRDNKLARAKNDPSARKNLQKTLNLVRDRIQEARLANDLALIEEFEEHEHKLLQELKESGHGHLSDLEDVRARKAIDIAIRRTLQAFKQQRFLKLHAHLKSSLRASSGDRMYLPADDSIAWLV